MFSHQNLALLIMVTLLAACGDGSKDADITDKPINHSPSEREDEWIVFSSGRSGEGDIYALHPSTGETVLIAGTSLPEGTVRYDRMRKRIVHHRYEEDRTLLISDGQVLFDDPNGDVAPSWSPDGSWIVYADKRKKTENLFLSRPDGTNERRLTNGVFTDRYPSWSPDSDRIIFARRLETGWDLHILGLNESPPSLKRLTNDGVYIGHPAWSPDSRFIAFDTLIDGDAEIAMIEVETGKITRLTDRPGNDLIPVWSSDSRRVVFGGDPGNAGNWDLWMVVIDTLKIRRLTTHAANDGGPVFVPASAIGR